MKKCSLLFLLWKGRTWVHFSNRKAVRKLGTVIWSSGPRQANEEKDRNMWGTFENSHQSRSGPSIPNSLASTERRHGVRNMLLSKASAWGQAAVHVKQVTAVVFLTWILSTYPFPDHVPWAFHMIVTNLSVWSRGSQVWLHRQHRFSWKQCRCMCPTPCTVTLPTLRRGTEDAMKDTLGESDENY